jgi:hypothetical protein
VAGFLKEVEAYKINVTEYEYYLKKHYKAEKNENDLSTAELEALLNSYLSRLKDILDHSPPPMEVLEIEDTMGEDDQVNEEEIIADIISKITAKEGPPNQKSASNRPDTPSPDPDLHEVLSLKHVAADHPVKPFKFKPDE